MTYAQLAGATLIWLTILGLPAAGVKSAIAEESRARAWEETITIPTYVPGPFDKNPIFYTGRVYQGAQGRVYPYPLQDVLHDKKEDRRYKALMLENEYLSMSLLPEIGGRLFSFTDKDSGFEIFYRQSVIKPALIGMLGAWTSGGVEWNFPHHHRATTLPVDYTIRENRREQDRLDRGDGNPAPDEMVDRPEHAAGPFLPGSRLPLHEPAVLHRVDALLGQRLRALR